MGNSPHRRRYQSSVRGIPAYAKGTLDVKRTRVVTRTESSRCRAVGHPHLISNRHPLAPPALPGFSATMDGSDFRAPPPVSSVICLFTGAHLRQTDARISLVSACSQCQARHGLGPRGVSAQLAFDAVLIVAYRRVKTVGTHQWNFRGSTPSRAASSATFAPRLLSCLRIDSSVTSRAARLDTGLVAHDYPGGTHTR